MVYDPGWGHIRSLYNIFYKHSIPPVSFLFDFHFPNPEGLHVYRNVVLQRKSDPGGVEYPITSTYFYKYIMPTASNKLSLFAVINLVKLATVLNPEG
jgi:hypothetical protein